MGSLLDVIHVVGHERSSDRLLNVGSIEDGLFNKASKLVLGDILGDRLEELIDTRLLNNFVGSGVSDFLNSRANVAEDTLEQVLTVGGASEGTSTNSERFHYYI